MNIVKVCEHICLYLYYHDNYSVYNKYQWYYSLYGLVIVLEDLIF